MKVSVNLTSGEKLTFEGDQAQQVVQQYKLHELGQTENTMLQYVDGKGERQGIEWRCLCGYTIHPTTTEEIPDRTCDPRDCIEPIVRPVDPQMITVTPTGDGAKIVAEAIEGIQLVLYKGITEEIEVGGISKGEVTLTGLAAGTAVIEGTYKIANRGPVRESYKVLVPAFKVLDKKPDETPDEKTTPVKE